MNKIYLVEDDPVIARAIEDHLTMWGYEVRTVQDFQRVLEEFTEFDPQLVLLDIGLPHRNGYYWCEEMRKRSKIPIVFLSSASDNMNIITAIDMGADDFIPKPFDLPVLTAKIQAVLRRAYSLAGSVNIIEHGGALLDLSACTLSCPGGKLELTKNEFRIVQVLMENAGHMVSREDLITRLWESDHFIDDNTLTVNMTRLRKKLKEMGLPDFIVTKKGMGYLIP